MKGFLVDTNIPSELTRGKPDVRVEVFLDKAGKASVFLSVVTIGEICKGIANLPAGQNRAGSQGWLDHTVRPWFSGRIWPVTAKRLGMTLSVVDGVKRYDSRDSKRQRLCRSRRCGR